VTRRPPTLHIPDLSKAPGAEVDAYGDVRCITCGTHVPVGDADIVGLGYRCRACIVGAVGCFGLATAPR
jgi:hypothetical protein